jgi:hypothetical protein
MRNVIAPLEPNDVSLSARWKRGCKDFKKKGRVLLLQLAELQRKALYSEHPVRRRAAVQGRSPQGRLRLRLAVREPVGAIAKKI